MKMIESIAYAMIDQLADCCQGETDLYWVNEEVHAVPAEGTPVEHGVFLTRLAACEDRDPVEAYLLTVCQGSVELLADELGRDADELYDMAEKDLRPGCDEIFPENVSKAIADYHPKLASRVRELYRAWLIENRLYDFKQEAAELVKMLENKASQARAEDKVMFEAKRFSLDGGQTCVNEDELGTRETEIKRRWAEIISAMDRRTCSYAAEQRYWEYQNDPVEFLRIYLEIAPEDLIVGGV